jgi:methylmalonyl-CoA mutase
MTDASDDDLALAAEFPPATREQWQKLVDEAVKGPSFESRIAETHDGLRIEPLSPRKSHATPVIGRKPGARWTIMQRVDHPQPAAANAEAVQDVANGATGLFVEVAGAPGAYGYGLAPREGAVTRALQGIELDSGIAVDLDAGPEPSDVADRIAALLESRGTTPAAINIRFGLDPIGTAAMTGGGGLSWTDVVRHLTDMIRHLADRGFHGPFAVADGRIVHNAGGSEAQELAYVLAAGVAYLRALQTAGIALDAARRMTYFRLAADVEQYLTVAKFRALRKLWARIEQACGLTPEPAFIAAETAWRMMTKRDPHVNILRTTIAVVSAGLGGADSIVVLPFTMPLGLPDGFARRIARNTQLVLLEESNLARVADPAAGSAGMEDLTDQLCRVAWTQFQDIESAGGAWRGLQQGEFQRHVATVRTQRRSALATRRDTLVGTTDFTDLAEVSPAMVKVAPAHAAVHRTEAQFEALAPIRLAEPFEELRDLSDQMLARTGARPKIFLANLGRISDFGPRSIFARNLFETGGIEALTNDGFTDRAQMIGAFERSGTKLACICSSDEIYALEATAAAEALRATGASLWLAGRPGMLAAVLDRTGICGFIFAGCDVLASLRKAYELIGA